MDGDCSLTRGSPLNFIYKTMIERDPSKRRIKPVSHQELTDINLSDSSEDSDFIPAEATSGTDDEGKEVSDSNPEELRSDESAISFSSNKSDTCIRESNYGRGQHLLYNSKIDSSHSVCMVCLGENKRPSEYLVECDLCGLVVHESCYGLIPTYQDRSRQSSDKTTPQISVKNIIVGNKNDNNNIDVNNKAIINDCFINNDLIKDGNVKNNINMISKIKNYNTEPSHNTINSRSNCITCTASLASNKNMKYCLNKKNNNIANNNYNFKDANNSTTENLNFQQAGGSHSFVDPIQLLLDSLCKEVENRDSIENASHTSSSVFSTEPWFCSPCRAGIKFPSCKLCPFQPGIGAYKETDMQSWVHLVCALYIPGVTFADVDKLNAVTLFELNYKRFGERECVYCEEKLLAKTGICIPCDAGLCKNYFHVTCAQKEGLLIENYTTPTSFATTSTSVTNPHPSASNFSSAWDASKNLFFNAGNVLTPETAYYAFCKQHYGDKAAVKRKRHSFAAARHKQIHESRRAKLISAAETSVESNVGCQQNNEEANFFYRANYPQDHITQYFSTLLPEGHLDDNKSLRDIKYRKRLIQTLINTRERYLRDERPTFGALLDHWTPPCSMFDAYARHATTDPIYMRQMSHRASKTFDVQLNTNFLLELGTFIDYTITSTPSHISDKSLSNTEILPHKVLFDSLKNIHSDPPTSFLSDNYSTVLNTASSGKLAFTHEYLNFFAEREKNIERLHMQSNEKFDKLKKLQLDCKKAQETCLKAKLSIDQSQKIIAREMQSIKRIWQLLCSLGGIPYKNLPRRLRKLTENLDVISTSALYPTSYAGMSQSPFSDDLPCKQIIEKSESSKHLERISPKPKRRSNKTDFLTERPQIKLEFDIKTYNNYHKIMDISSIEKSAQSCKCSVCLKQGPKEDLLECDTCKRLFHLACLDPPLKRRPVLSRFYNWQCSECVDHINQSLVITISDDEINNAHSHSTDNGKSFSTRSKDTLVKNQSNSPSLHNRHTANDINNKYNSPSNIPHMAVPDSGLASSAKLKARKRCKPQRFSQRSFSSNEDPLFLSGGGCSIISNKRPAKKALLLSLNSKRRKKNKSRNNKSLPLLSNSNHNNSNKDNDCYVATSICNRLPFNGMGDHLYSKTLDSGDSDEDINSIKSRQIFLKENNNIKDLGSQESLTPKFIKQPKYQKTSSPYDSPILPKLLSNTRITTILTSNNAIPHIQIIPGDD